MGPWIVIAAAAVLTAIVVWVPHHRRVESERQRYLAHVRPQFAWDCPLCVWPHYFGCGTHDNEAWFNEMRDAHLLKVHGITEPLTVNKT